MTISIPAKYEKYIAQQVQTGRFPDPETLVMEALSAFIDAEPLDTDAELERLESGLDKHWLRQQITIGIDEADRGLIAPLDIEEIKAEGRRRHAADRSVAKG